MTESVMMMPDQQRAPRANATAPSSATFDGVICFGGEDWWYHNRGHFDMQMMRELSRHVPVLYINSIGMRVPRVGEGTMFVRRVVRKLRSVRRGYVSVRANFSVITPVAGPGALGRRVTRAMLPRQVRGAARKLGIKRPLIWVACPPGADYVDALDPVGVVYQRTDRYESFQGVDPDEIKGYDNVLKRRAALTIYCSRSLKNDEASTSTQALFIDHGVDYERFAAAGRGNKPEPADLATIGRPRVGFVGGIDSHTFDPPLLTGLAQRMPDVQFVLVGACSLPEGWCDEANVHLLGQRAYEDVPSYMAACDVLIMPWNDSTWIKACNPVKLKEYLAVGRPVVSSPFDELEHYNEYIEVADNIDDFAHATRHAIEAPGDADSRRQRVEHQTWSAKAEHLLQSLEEVGLRVDRQ
jgi:glycosyltransferase involved in cell wall biosynthesis